jgi:hypothetical protein
VSTLIGDSNPPAFTSNFFVPAQIYRANYFDALKPAGGTTKLLVLPAQYQNLNGTTTQRAYDQVRLRLFYSSYTGQAALATAPAVTNVAGTASGNVVTFQATVTGDPSAGIQSVWVSWTGAGGGAGHWQSLDLSPIAGTANVYSGQLPLPTGTAPSDVRFIVQAANGTGLVTVADNLGAYIRVFDASAASVVSATSVTLDANPTSGTVNGQVGVGATLKTGSTPVSGKKITFQVGSDQIVATTDGSGHASANLPITSVPGAGYQLSASFAGDSSYQPSGDTRAFTIAKQNTSTTLSGPANAQVGTPSGIVATLKDSSGAPIQFKTIWYVTTGASSSTIAVLTDISGVASYGIAPNVGGAYTIAACFSKPSPTGACPSVAPLDDTYNGSAAAPTLAFNATWPFTGFFSPINNLPTVNTAKSGSSIPVKFSLGGDRGLAILASGYPKTTAVSCTTAPQDPVEDLTTSTSGLQYDATSNQYTYVWKTTKGKTGCFQLDLKLVDGQTYSAMFKLT